MRLSTIFKALFGILLVFVLTLGGVLYKTDFSHYKSEISILVKALTNRDLVLGGKFKVSLGLRPAIAVDRVTFANAKWGSRREMMRIDKLRAELELFPLLYGDIRIKRVVLLGADILLETRADGVGNWNLQPAARKSAEPEELPIIPTFDRVLIKNSVLVWRDGRTGDRHNIKIDRLRTRAAAADAPLKLDLKGSYNRERVRLDGNINSLAALTSNKPTSVALNLYTGGARVKVRGEIRKPMTASGVKVSLTAAGKNIRTLSGLFGSDLPSIGPYDLAATVVDRKRSRWRLKWVKLKIGQSDFRGDVYFDPNTNPVRVFANLQSDLVRAADLQDRRKPKKRGRSKKTKREAARRIFSAERLSFPGLELFSAKVALKAKRIQIDDIAFDDAAFTVSIRKDRLILRPARARFDGGNLKLYFKLTSAKRRLRFNMKADLKRLDLAKLVNRLGYPGLATGRINAKTSLSGTGTSIRSIMARLNGHLLTTMNSGRIDNRMFAKLSGETVASILPWSSVDKGIHVKCLVGQYGIKKGKIVSNVTLLNTDRLLVEGEGGVDLASEKVDFKIIPRAKEASLVNLLVPIKIDGKLAAPDVYADPAGVARNALGFATGGILANGIVSEIIGSIVAGLSGSDKTNPCVAAKTDAINATPSSSKKKKRKKAPKDGGENMLDSIGDGLKSLFGR
jgi:uncharacterized protein involved in outer membrane biogenesis